MTLKKNKLKIELEQIVEATCDKCEKEIMIDFDHDGTSRMLNGKEVNFTGGYWSNHDMKTIECVFCEDCYFDILMPYGKIKTWYEE